MKEPEVLIKINGKVHRLKMEDPATIKKMTWEDRKQLIKLLDVIKQAEHIKPQAHKDDVVEPAASRSSVQAKPSAGVTAAAQQNNVPELDSMVKKSSADVDAIMAQLVLAEKGNKSEIPDKSMVIKWFLIVMVVIVVLAWLF